MQDISKCDPVLGEKVHQHLLKCGLLTDRKENNFTIDEKIEVVKNNINEILTTLGYDITDGSLQETGKRVAKYWVDEAHHSVTHGWNTFPKCTMFDVGDRCEGSFVYERGLRVNSLCSHHLAPFFGVGGSAKEGLTFSTGCNIAYIPKDKIIGISKLGHVVDWLAASGNCEETLCAKIGETLRVVLGTDDIAVFMNAYHTCQMLRSTKQGSASTVCLWTLGRFKTDGQIRQEFLSMCK